MGIAFTSLLLAVAAVVQQKGSWPQSPPSPMGITDDAALRVEPAAWTTVGGRIPDLELPLIDGSGPFDLASLRGKKVLLIQFASW